MSNIFDLAHHTDLTSAWWIALAAMLSPLLSSLTRKKVPDVVWLLLLGVIIGPSVLNFADIGPGIAFVRELGLGLLFFIAGMEINMEQLVDKAGKHARGSYLLCLALGIAAGLAISHGDVRTAIVLGIASTSTALGTLLPILKDSGKLATPLGSMAMRHGAIGELGPIIAMTLLLSARAAWQSALVLIGFVVAAAFVVYLPAHVFRNVPWISKALISGVNTTQQTGLRFSMLVLISLMALTSMLNLDVVLGAFVAGLLIGRLVAQKPETKEIFDKKLEIMGFSFLIPVFFVTSGMGIDASVVAKGWAKVVLVVLLILLVRGLPVWWRERRRVPTTTAQQLSPVEQVALALYAAVGLPIIVAVTEVATASELITDDDASLLVAAGAVTVLLFPMVADQLLRRKNNKPVSAGKPA
ncbi:cation:proton antiporter [Corynebacterium aquilae]|uniref:cation:proton antiporter n=1 Tax=Corynebacterium aquilae TaxID=203263 RepID=UPI0009520162|nr:cation:proton antiporter [Corynebacterium aquilae]